MVDFRSLLFNLKGQTLLLQTIKQYKLAVKSKNELVCLKSIKQETQLVILVNYIELKSEILVRGDY